MVTVINSGKTRDPILAAITRNIAMLTATQDINLKLLHIPGKQNIIALGSLAPDHILCFLEFLVSNKVSHSGIADYMSAVKTKLSMYGLSVASFSDPRLRYFSR